MDMKLSPRIESQLPGTRAELRRLTLDAYYSKTPDGGCTVRMIACLDGEYRPAYPYDRPTRYMQSPQILPRHSST
ncbi:hypothetical protein [Burkholderia gladioli]|uniref:hypothetical protein n=1 Tax=Burkholderia gladioli TaxID=28095 RepID=UPI001641F8A1|nr:hypothetical protein [Burkholderia gladioli]